MTRRLALVANPAAGHGRAARLIPQVAERLRAGIPDLDLSLAVSTSFEDARNACAAVVDAGVDGLLVMGGDGSTHLGLNACANTGVPLGIIPAGTGNDFCRGVGLPRRWRDAVDVIVAGDAAPIDLMEVTGPLYAGEREYVGSVLSTGFDERVNYRTNNLPFSLGAPSYAWSVLTELRGFTPLRYRIEIDGEARELDAMLIAVANAGVFGGGIRIAPDADVTDGLLDVTIIHPVPRRTLLRLFPKLFSGAFTSEPSVEQVRASSVVVDGDDLYGMADGEDIGRPPLTCRVAPGAVRVFGAGGR